MHENSLELICSVHENLLKLFHLHVFKILILYPRKSFGTVSSYSLKLEHLVYFQFQILENSKGIMKNLS